MRRQRRCSCGLKDEQTFATGRGQKRWEHATTRNLDFRRNEQPVPRASGRQGFRQHTEGEHRRRRGQGRKEAG